MPEILYNNDMNIAEFLRNRSVKRTLSMLKLAALVFVVVILPVLLIIYRPELLENFKSREAVDAMVERYRSVSVFFFLAIQIIQIVISVIPGQAVQMAAGYTYSFGIAYIVSMGGAFLGTVAAYYIARFLGRDAMHVIFGDEKIRKFTKTLNSRGAVVTAFVLFLFPGIPKDTLIYAAGISEMKAKIFIPISLIARTPAMMGSILLGGMWKNGSYTGMIILGSVSLALFVLGVIFHSKFTAWFNRVYDRFTENGVGKPK
ncbi:MAG: VTT domain-containing protein [Clostridiales Family XIII bacterium]|jgi:uncharacterized membrane protein YdjX (TVP38/TMEM64 family)|nr:VTT domain-containing protein [Clostridiales Family XIII bacterium]